MKQYLLSIYQPEADPPPSEVLAPIMRDVDALVQEVKAARATTLPIEVRPFQGEAED